MSVDVRGFYVFGGKTTGTWTRMRPVVVDQNNTRGGEFGADYAGIRTSRMFIWADGFAHHILE